MARRVFTPNSKKEQLQRQVLMLIRIIRGKMDGDILAKAQEIALSLHEKGKRDTVAHTLEKNNSEILLYDKDNAKAAIAEFLVLNKNNPNLCQKILKAMDQGK